MESKKSTITAESLFIGGLLLVALVVTAIAITPNWRQAARDLVSPEQRVILAKVTGDLTGQGPHVIVLKIKLRDSLVLEIYDAEKSDENALMARIVLPEKRDGYFQLKGNATNLGLADVDNDGTMEIVAPAFDDQMIARLNIYKFNPATRSFDRMNAPAGSEF